MNRRSFIRFLATAGLTSLTPGCVTGAGGLLGGLQDLATRGADGLLEWTPDALANANLAKVLFDYVDHRGYVPIMPTGWVLPGEMENSLKQWEVTRDKYPAGSTIDLDGGIDLAEAVAPVLRIIVRLSGPQKYAAWGDGSLYAAAKIRKPKSNSETSKKDDGHDPRTQSGPPVPTVSGGGVWLPAGGRAQFSSKGFCLDPNLGAPGAGEKFRLVPLMGGGRTMLPEVLIPIYKGLLRLLQNKESRTDRSLFQHAFWALRTAGTESPFANNVSPQVLALMDEATPGGSTIFLNYHQQQIALAKAGRALYDLIGVDRYLNAIASPTLTIAGRTIPAMELRDPIKSIQIVQNLMQDMTGMKIPGMIPADNSNYTMLPGGIAARAVGASTLTPNIELINVTNSPVQFDPWGYAAETRRKAQRVGLPTPESINGRLLTSPREDPAFWDGAPQGAFQTLSEKYPLIHAFADDLQKFSVDRSFSYGTKIAEEIGRDMISRKLTIFSGMLALAPVLGNMKGAYEAYTGVDLLTRERLSTAERVLAGMSVIPGANVLKTLGVTQATKIGAWALKSAGIMEKVNDVASYFPHNSAQYVSQSMTGRTIEENMLAAINDAKSIISIS